MEITLNFYVLISSWYDLKDTVARLCLRYQKLCTVFMQHHQDKTSKEMCQKYSQLSPPKRKSSSVFIFYLKKFILHVRPRLQNKNHKQTVISPAEITHTNLEFPKKTVTELWRILVFVSNGTISMKQICFNSIKELRSIPCLSSWMSNCICRLLLITFKNA